MELVEAENRQCAEWSHSPDINQNASFQSDASPSECNDTGLLNHSLHMPQRETDFTYATSSPFPPRPVSRIHRSQSLIESTQQGQLQVQPSVLTRRESYPWTHGESQALPCPVMFPPRPGILPPALKPLPPLHHSNMHPNSLYANHSGFTDPLSIYPMHPLMRLPPIEQHQQLLQAQHQQAYAQEKQHKRRRRKKGHTWHGERSLCDSTIIPTVH